MIGRIGVAVSGADPNRVYALVENDNGGLFSSDDAGATWTLVNEQPQHPAARVLLHARRRRSEEQGYRLPAQRRAYRSTDGGKTLANVGGGSHSDHHDLWIDPDDPQHIVIAQRWRWCGARRTGGRVDARRTSRPPQYYHVVTTKHMPYHVCGAQQDGSTRVRAERHRGGRRRRAAAAVAVAAARAPRDCYSPGGSETGYIAPDPARSGRVLLRHEQRRRSSTGSIGARVKCAR